MLGYLLAHVLALTAFLLLRKDRPGWPRPIRAHNVWVPIAALLAVANLVFIFFGVTNPDLTGYGSREWLIAIISDPAHKRFYGTRNDRMPAYAKDPEKPDQNVLSATQIELLANWLRGAGSEPRPSAE